MTNKISNYLALIVVIVSASNILFLSIHTEIIFAKKIKSDDDKNDEQKRNYNKWILIFNFIIDNYFHIIYV